MRRAASIPSMPGILMSRMARSGLVRATSSTASSPRPVSPTISYPSVSRISLRSKRMMASSSAITTRLPMGVPPRIAGGCAAGRRAAGRLARIDGELAQQLVLAALELDDGVGQRTARPRCRVHVTLGVGVLVRGHRCLRYERPQPRLVGGIGADGQLLVEHGELLARLDQA